MAAAYAAYALGDGTAKAAGRLSLNPLRYVAPVGTLVVPAILFFMGSKFVFGWPKQAPVDPHNFPHPRRDLALLAVSAPVANLLMAIAWTIFAGLAARRLPPDSVALAWLGRMSAIGLLLNVLLAVWNLLPIPPLAGGRLLIGALPLGAARVLAELEPYGLWILLALVFFLDGSGYSLAPLVARIIDWIVRAFA